MTRYLYDGEGERFNVATKIRPVLEECLRYRFPDQFAPTESLGDFIQKIRDADDTSPLFAAQKIVDELGDISDYSKKFHHSSTTAATIGPIDDGELQGYIRRTLKIVGGH